MDRVAKLVPGELHITLDRALAQSSELKELYDGDSKIRELVDTARSIEGMPRHASTHAAGAVSYTHLDVYKRQPPSFFPG